MDAAAAGALLSWALPCHVPSRTGADCHEMLPAANGRVNGPPTIMYNSGFTNIYESLNGQMWANWTASTIVFGLR